MTFKHLLVLLLCFIPSWVFSQHTADVIPAIEKALHNQQKTTSDVLTDTAFLYLHSLTPFRELIKQNATAGEVAIAAPTEPGVRMVVNGMVKNKSGSPLPNILIYFYHTSDKGWYADTAVHILEREGDHKHARLFGYDKTDKQGKFKIHTIRPNGYPKSDLAAHIHIQMWKEDGSRLAGIPGELQFADDVRMTEARRKKSMEEGFLIAENVGTKAQPVYNYTITSKED